MAPLAKPRAAVGFCFIWPALFLALAGCARQPQQAAAAEPSPAPNAAAAACDQVGIASWYRGSPRGRTSPQDLVAAHRTLPFGTFVQVTAIDTGQAIVVRINDRGPFGRGRVIDISRAAADQLGMRRDGVARVRLEPVGGSVAAGEGCPFEEARAE